MKQNNRVVEVDLHVLVVLVVSFLVTTFAALFYHDMMRKAQLNAEQAVAVAKEAERIRTMSSYQSNRLIVDQLTKALTECELSKENNHEQE